MSSWLDYLRRGLARAMPHDGIASPSERPAPRQALRTLRPIVTRHWRKAAVGGLIVLGTSLLSLPQPLVNRYLLDDVILGRQLRLLAGAVIALGALKGLERLGNLAYDFYFQRLEREVLLDIQNRLFERTLSLPKTFFDERQTGYLMARLSSDVTHLRGFLSSSLVFLAQQVLRLVGGIALLFYLEWRLALASIVVVPGLALAVRVFTGRLRVLGHRRMEQEAHVTERLQEALSATTLVKAFRTEERTARRVESELTVARDSSLEQAAVRGVANLLLNLMPDAARALTLVIGAILVVRNEWTLGSLLAFQGYLGYVFGPVQFLAATNLQLQEPLAALERISAMFDIVPEEQMGAGVRAERLRGEIAFKDVSFSYDGREAVLEDLSCLIQPGERIAIVGPSGVGKTTLLSLILRFYRPTAGEIWFDGRPASDYEVGSLRERIGYVAQSTLLLTGTIGENLRYGNLGASDEQVVRAAKVAGIHDFVAGLSEGYGSPVGEQGVNLSEGQKQRLAIARALIKEPDILVLDEPTSQLDSHAERSFLAAMPTLVKGKTLFIVAHRLSTVRDADRILLLNQKRLVATGTHEELLESSDYYRSIVANQQILAPGL
jgi:subfamily B ATP-binding cassette protein MsbA